MSNNQLRHLENLREQRRQLTHLENLREQHRRRLRFSEAKAAAFGINTQPEVLIEIEDLRAQLVQLEQEIEDLRNKLVQLEQEIEKIKNRPPEITETEPLGSSVFKLTTEGIILTAIVGIILIGALAYTNRGWINGSGQGNITSTQPTLIVTEPTHTSVAGIATNPASTPSLVATLPIGPSVVGITTTPPSPPPLPTEPSLLTGTCFVDLFADTPSERVVLLEIGETEHDVPITQSSAPGAIALNVVLTQRGLPIGAVRYALNMNARITNVDRVVTADCTETHSYRNVNRPNAQATLQDSEFLEITIGDKRYFVSLNYRVIKVRLLAKAE
jgi:hypothetical protein